MDRFIGNFGIDKLASFSSLKSNMDRFIDIIKSFGVIFNVV